MSTRIASVLVLAALTVGVVFLVGHDPKVAGTYPPCPTFALTGLMCPGCGTLRALYALLHGDLASAWRANPLAVLAAPLMLWGVVALARAAVTGRAPRFRFVSPRLGPWLLVGAAVYMVIRNV